jgi:hypothetical protein
MFAKSLRIGPGIMTARRSPRRTKPSLERLDVRIAPSGLHPAVPAADVHTLEGRPVEVTRLMVKTSSPSVMMGGGFGRTEPGHIVSAGGYSR